ncbi:C1 family peptidase [Olsenella sp. YH-ols2217]|uniref:Aminopeptidase n=1 Tax=Kribbibacterium absianum TaxID=3044210 RepID=A0ABT6ZL51_9ACTN|nr:MULTISPECIES: C1 family peptidase [unclassified Olsenella]MDJ1121757.1 C1 family peptidase [Olsenella sp. YH-ols2216]MDJ1129765.1 C1 family peptidase [Olsenella sp. YH-ols2217]
MELTKQMLATYSEQYRDAAAQHISENAVKNNGIKAAAQSEGYNSQNLQPAFSIDVDDEAVANQLQAGFCWDFAGNNFLRWHMEKNLDLKHGSFQLSQLWIAFWDKLEKSNAFLERMVEYAGDPMDDRRIAWLLQNPQQDGGDWDPFCALVDKYGVVPLESMPFTEPAKNTAEVNAALNRLLRQDALELRTMANDGKGPKALDDRRAEMMSEVYRMLCISFGEPPTKVDFEYRDAKKNYHRDAGLTPQEFYKKYLSPSVNLADYVSVVNCPTDDTPYNQVYGLELAEQMIGGRQIRYLNVDIDALKGLIIDQLKGGEPVWFACNVVPDSNFVSGVLSEKLYDFEQLFGITWTQDKTEQFLYLQNAMDHAMMIAGVDIVEGKPVRWKIENSWGTKNNGKPTGHDGYFLADDDWFSMFLWEAAINKKYLDEDQKKALEGDVTMLPYYSQL